MSAPEKILLVDDEPQILDAYSRALRKKFSIETALSGEEGLQALSEKGPFAVVVSDMQMPEMDGIKFLSRVKKRYPHSVRIMLTGNSDQRTAVSAINEGDVFRFLTKPCSNEEMTAAIADGIERHHCEAIEHNLLLESTRQLDYLSESQENNPEVQSLNEQSAKLGKLAAVLAKSSNLGKESVEQCHMAGMMSCIGDLVVATRFKQAGSQQASGVEPTQLAAYMLGTWGLPKAVVEGIRNHRKPILATSQASLSVTSVLHSAWYFLQPNDQLPTELQEKTKFGYLSSFAGEEIAKIWLTEHLKFTQKDAADV